MRDTVAMLPPIAPAAITRAHIPRVGRFSITTRFVPTLAPRINSSSQIAMVTIYSIGFVVLSHRRMSNPTPKPIIKRIITASIISKWFEPQR